MKKVPLLTKKDTGLPGFEPGFEDPKSSRIIHYPTGPLSISNFHYYDLLLIYNSRLSESKTDFCFYRYISCKPELTIFTNMDSKSISYTIIRPISLIFFEKVIVYEYASNNVFF